MLTGLQHWNVFYGVGFSRRAGDGMLCCADQRARYSRLRNVMCVWTVNQAAYWCRTVPELLPIGLNPFSIANRLVPHNLKGPFEGSHLVLRLRFGLGSGSGSGLG